MSLLTALLIFLVIVSGVVLMWWVWMLSTFLHPARLANSTGNGDMVHPDPNSNCGDGTRFPSVPLKTVVRPDKKHKSKGGSNENIN
jgi:hypothetical protein